MMINDNTWKTIELLIKDAEFFDGFQGKLEKYELPNTTEEEQKAMIKNAYIFMMHVVDYYATFKMIDMDADLARLCRENPCKAEKLRESMNKSALILKENYQRLLTEHSVYSRNIWMFPMFYSKLILQPNLSDNDETVPFPLDTPLSEIELISANDDKTIRAIKSRAASEMELREESVTEFVDNLFKWSDTIADYLDRLGEYKTVAQIGDGKLRELYDFCISERVITSCMPDHFARALRNEKIPKFHLLNKDTFYSIIYGIYEFLGKFGTRDTWRNEILVAFDIERTSYSSLESRIKNGNLSKVLKERYERIKEILEIDN